MHGSGGGIPISNIDWGARILLHIHIKDRMRVINNKADIMLCLIGLCDVLLILINILTIFNRADISYRSKL